MADVALKALAAAVPSGASGDPDPSEFFGRLTVATDKFLEGLVAAAASADDAPRLLTAIYELNALAAEARGASRFRPWVAAWRAIDDVLVRLREMAEHYLRALSSNSPMEAQLEAQEAQRVLDLAGAPAEFLADRMERWEAIRDEPRLEDSLAVMAGQAFSSSGASNLLEFDAVGGEIYLRVTGHRGCPQGLGFTLNILAQQAEGPIDDARFWDVAQQTHRILTDDPTWLRTLIQDPSWVEAFNDSLIRAWDSSVLLEGMAAAVRHERQAVKAQLEKVEALIEGPGQILAATLLAAVKRAPYAKYKDQSAGLVVGSTTDQPQLRALFQGLDPALRRSAAHDEFRIDGDVVILMNQGRDVRRLSSDEFIDLVLAAEESTTAIGLGTLCAAVEGGFDVDQLVDVVTDRLDHASRVALVLAGAGWANVEARMENGILHVTGSGDLTLKALPTAAALIPLLPDECLSMVLESDRGSARELRGPTAPMRRFGEAEDPLIKLGLNIETVRLWELDGHSLCSDDHVRKVLSLTALQRLQEASLPRSMALLREYRDIALRLGLADLERGFAEVMAAIREDPAVDPGALTRALLQLRDWVNLRVSDLRL